MKIFGIGLLLIAAALVGCANRDSAREIISYYDRNGDGMVDLEVHHVAGTPESNWEMRDDNFDGRYEQKATYGEGIIRVEVDLPVATGVRVRPLQ